MGEIMRDSINNFIDLLVKGDSFLIFLVIMLVIIIGVIVCLVKLQIGDREYYEDDEEIEDDNLEIKAVTEDLVPKASPTLRSNEREPEFAKFIAPEQEEVAPRVTLKEKMREYESQIQKEEKLVERPIERPVEKPLTYPIKEEIDNEVEEILSNNTYEMPNRRVVEQSRFNFDSDFEKEVEDVIQEEENNETLVPTNYSYQETSDKVDDLVRSSFELENSISKMSNENDYEEEIPYNNLQSPLEFSGYKKEEFVPPRNQEFSSPRNIEVEEPEIDEISEYEREQENHAIISARELDNKINTMKETGEFEQHQEELRKYEQELEQKAIISYDELLSRASDGVVSYESEEKLGGISVGKVDTKQIETVRETDEKPYYKEEAFLEAMKEFRRAL